MDGGGDYHYLPGTGLPTGLLVGQPADPAEQPADDSGAVAFLDIDPGAGGGLDRAAAVGRADQQRADGHGHHRPAAGAGVQPHRCLHLDGAHPAAVHDPAAVQRDEGYFPELHACGDLAGLPPVRQFLAGVLPADLRRCWRRLPAGVHPCHRLLHHPGAAR
ncbi:hypothetical protein D9M73_194940 [compost metagenome]